MLSPSLERPDLPAREGVTPSCVTLPEGKWNTVLEYFAHRFSRFPIEEWEKRMLLGDVFDASGKQLNPETPYQPHRKIYYYRRLPPELPIPFEETIIYRDELIIVADKPHFLPVMPSGRYLKETLLVRLKNKLKINTLVPMHRIDQDTAGLVLFTIQPKTRNAYQSLFRERKVEKNYEAIAPVNPALNYPLHIKNRLSESPESFMQMRVTDGTPNAETGIKLITRKNNLARYALHPITGQRHQLRVHMAHLGTPILNDRIYPVLEPERPFNEPPDYNRPLQLLAKIITFTDPITGKTRHFESKRKLIF